MPDENGTNDGQNGGEGGSANAANSAAAGAAKTFTQEDLDRIIAERLNREKSKYADYDQLKQAAEGRKTEMEKLADQLRALQEENEANKVKALRSEVASEKKVPASLLNGASTREEMEAQADAILKFVEAQTPKGDKKDNANNGKISPFGSPKENLRGGSDNSGEPSRDDLLKQIMGRR